MTKLVWDSFDNNLVTYGVDQGVLYPHNKRAIAWNGLVSVSEKLIDSNLTTGYFDGQKYTQDHSPEGFSASVEAFFYPDELELDSPFGLSYRVSLYKGYELHLIYNAEAFSNDSDYASTDSKATPTLFKWDVSTTPIQLEGVRSSSHFVINSNDVRPNILEDLENLLYGVEGVDPRLPSGVEVINLFDLLALFRIIDNGDGTWTAIGPDSWFETIDSTTVDITTPSIEFMDEESYQIRSW
jgi:hypothetical protein